MKHPHSNLITQFARMVEAGHPIEQLVQARTLSGGVWVKCGEPRWYPEVEYRVALAFVEGRPVFEGDVLYFKESGVRATFNRRHDDGSIHGVCCDKYGAAGTNDPAQFLTWTKPIPEGFTEWTADGVIDLTGVTQIELLQRSGARRVRHPSEVADWVVRGTPSDIVAYRILARLPAPHPAEPIHMVLADHEERIARIERLVHP